MLDIQLVAIERKDTKENVVYGSSGIMLNKKYVITTSNILFPLIDDDFLKNVESLTPSKLHYLSDFKKTPHLKVVWKCFENSRQFYVKTGNIFAVLSSKCLKLSVKNVLRNWSIDTQENSYGLGKILSLFFIIHIEDTAASIDDFLKLLDQWRNIAKYESLNQCDEIFIKSVPFGSKFFMDSYSRGIISNIVGHESSLILSDSPVTSGSEGSPVYKVNSNINVPCGIVVSSACWWKRDWTGLTLILNIRSLLHELLEPGFKQDLETSLISSDFVANTLNTCFLQVYCGLQWGTAIIINVDKGILITNSHVIKEDSIIEIYWKGQSHAKADLIYRSPDETECDLAILKCSSNFLQQNRLHAVNISENFPVEGEEVYSVGFGIFSKNVICNPSISRGYISYCDPSIISTTCCINPGMSGGAILNKKFELLGIIVCNSRTEDTVYPRLNMAIPYSAIAKAVEDYLISDDISVLRKISIADRRFWKMLNAKL